MLLNDSAVRLIDMTAYAYQSKLIKTAIWVAEQNGHDSVTTAHVTEAVQVLSDSKWEQDGETSE